MAKSKPRNKKPVPPKEIPSVEEIEKEFGPVKYAEPEQPPKKTNPKPGRPLIPVKPQKPTPPKGSGKPRPSIPMKPKNPIKSPNGVWTILNK